MPASRSPVPPSPSSITAAAAAAVAAAAANNNSNINPALANTGEDAATQLSNNIQLGHMDSAQILALLRHLPGVFNKLTDGTLKEGTASQLQEHLAGAMDGGPNDQHSPTDNPYPDEPDNGPYTLDHADQPFGLSVNRRRRTEAGSEEWVRQRKLNHKEVERRRRGNINEGINNLATMIPATSAESKNQAKGAILSRAAQYIQQLKDNEARNIEKWTLEKLLMDQAMGDLQAQLEEMRKMWEDEHTSKVTLEAEVTRLQAELRTLEDGREPEGNSRKRARAE